MARQENAPIRSASRSLIVAAFVVLIGIGAATAFGVGFSGALQDSLANPSSAPALRIAALERIRDVLGYDGFLKAYREGAEAPRIAGIAGEAHTALERFRAAGDAERDAADARAIASLLTGFDSAVRDRMAGIPAPDPSALEQQYGALKIRIAEAIAGANYRRIDTLSHAFAMAQTLAVLALAVLALTLFGLAWFVRTRLLEPVRALRSSIEQAADGGPFGHLWGVQRKDEIGGLARACNRLRRQFAEPSALSPGPGGEMRAILENSAQGPPLAAPDGGVAVAARRFEGDLATILSAVGDARTRIEDASRDAARASQTAIEAANLARVGAQRLTARAESTILAASDEARQVLTALSSSIARLTTAASRLEGAPAVPLPLPKEPDARALAEQEKIESDIYAALSRLAGEHGIAIEKSGTDQGERSEGAAPGSSVAPLAGLAADLDSLESLTRRENLGEGEAQVMTAALIEAIDRLNGVVERVAAAAETKAPLVPSPARESGGEQR